MTRWNLAATAATLAMLVCGSGAGAEPGRLNLPIPPQPFAGKIAENVADSMPSPRRPVRAPQGAPNILMVMTDDVGFGMASAFGGPVPTPNLDRLARSGESYSRFHTTAICSATRAALLTGRNHHQVGTGYVSDTAEGYPGYNAHFPASAATVARILTLNGYNTAMFGKHHNIPSGEETAAGPFDMWPTGLGFEYFYGWITADTDQFHPNLYRGTNRVSEPAGNDKLLDQRLADDAISWIHNQNAAAPDKPFFIYVAPGSIHAPQQAPAHVIAGFKGQFDEGWDKMRVETWRRQIAMGIIPPGTKLTARPDGIPAWNSLTGEEKLFAERSMEVAAAQLAFQDRQFGRIVDELERMGQLDNTLVVFIEGDNGAEAGSGPKGTINEIGLINRVAETDAAQAANIDRLGGEYAYGNYPAGWAWAMNAPLRWAKQYTSMLGGIRNGMVMSWKGRVAKPGSVCAQFGHVVDIAPTLLEAAGVPAPETVYGVAQQPMSGESLLSSLAACEPTHPRTQYFEMVGKIGLYHNGWFASRDDGRLPWDSVPPPGGPDQGWTLYNLDRDFSQSTDVAARNPAKLQELISLWQAAAEQNQVYPIDHRFAAARGGLSPPGRKVFDFWGKDVSLLANRGPVFAGKSFTLDAELKLARPEASGVVVALGSHFGGWTLYLDQGRPTFVYARSTNPSDITRIAANQRLPDGAANLRLSFTSHGFLQGADIEISSGGNVLASGQLTATFLTPAGLGETLDIGRDLGVTVTGYASPHGEIEGDVPHINITFK